MLKKYLLYGICGCLLTLIACNKDEEEVTEPSYADADWFCIPDKPGEFNQLAYDIYTETGVALFVNDTLGEEYYAKDASGNPLIRQEMFNVSYMLFGNTVDQAKALMEYVVQSSDTSAMVTAANLIRERVIPHLPQKGTARPKCYFLVDSVNMQKFVGIPGHQVIGGIAITDTCVIPVTAKAALKGVAVGQLDRINEMSEEEQHVWCGRILGSKITAWLLERADLSNWYNISEQAGVSYNRNYGSATVVAKNDPKKYGMLRWYIDHEHYKVSFPQDQDVTEFIAYVYAYRGREADFVAKYGEYENVIQKFDMMCAYVSAFEREVGIR